MNACKTCGTYSSGDYCRPCWQGQLKQLAALQREALAAGRAALRAGRPVLYVHGSPYPAPDTDLLDDTEDFGQWKPADD